jgi:hypothetical protein
VAGLAHNTQSR